MKRQKEVDRSTQSVSLQSTPTQSATMQSASMQRKGKAPFSILISPAKNMTQVDSLPVKGEPRHLEDTKILLKTLQAMTDVELQTLWKVKDALARQNIERIRSMDLTRNLSPAVLTYVGIQYQHLAPEVLSEGALAYLEEHLRILSGFYGVLRPFDGIVPYRLEMQAKLSVEGRGKNLYSFWGEKLWKDLQGEWGEDPSFWILGLASKEYAKAIEPYLDSSDRMITCVFGEEKNGKILEKATQVKAARGEMVRFLAERGITDPEGLKAFDGIHWFYEEAYSDETRATFAYH